MSNIAIFPGSFDPFTIGHADIVERGASLFDKVIIGIGINSQKKRFFETDFMINKIQTYYQNNPKIEVLAYEGLTAEFAKTQNANFILRGLRNATDLEYENAIARANKYLNENLETVYLMTDPAHSHISSTIVREIYKHKNNIDPFLPYNL